MSAGSGTTGKHSGWNCETSDAETITREIGLWMEEVIYRCATHLAIVKDKNNQDNTLTVFIPATGRDESNPQHWIIAYPSGPVFAELPNADSEVFVFFEGGDFQRAKWIWAGQKFKADPDTGEIKEE